MIAASFANDGVLFTMDSCAAPRTSPFSPVVPDTTDSQIVSPRDTVSRVGRRKSDRVVSTVAIAIPLAAPAVAVTSCLTLPLPSVHAVCARPLLSVVTVALATVPAPRVTANSTALPATGLPWAFVTRTAIGAASGVPGTPTWLLPLLIAIAADVPLEPPFVGLSEQAAAASNANAVATTDGRNARMLCTIRRGEGSFRAGLTVCTAGRAKCATLIHLKL